MIKKNNIRFYKIIEKDLDDRQKRIIENIGRFGNDSKELYRAALFAYYNYDIPARQMIVAHCLNELMNSIIRNSENEREIESECEAEFNSAITNLKFVKDAGWKKDELKRKIKELWKNEYFGANKTLRNERIKIKRLLSDTNLVDNSCNNFAEQGKKFIELGNVNNMREAETNNIREIKGKLHRLRHFDSELKKVNDEELKEYFDGVEKFLSIVI
jgi:hypothetical protein